MVRHILVLGLIIYIASFYTVVFNVGIGRTFPLSYLTLTLLLFITSLFGKLSYFKYTLVLFLICSVCYLIYLFINKKLDVKDSLKKIIRPSLFFYIIVFTYLRFELKNVEFNNVDDLHCYGIKLLDMIKTDTLFNNLNVTVYGNSTFHPLNVLISYTFVKLYGRTDNFIAILGVSSYCFSFLLFLLDKYELKKKNIVKILILFVTVMAITLMIQTNISIDINLKGYTPYLFSCTYRDWLLSYALAYGMYAIFNYNEGDNYTYIEIAMCTCVLAMAKDLGIALALLLWAMFYIYLVLVQKRVIIDKSALIKFIFISVGIPLIIYGSWIIQKGIFTGSFGVASAQNIAETSENVIDTSYRLTTMNVFIDNYFTGTLMSHPFKMSYFFVTLLMFAIISLIIYITRQNKEKYSISELYFLGSIGYALALLIAYCTVFAEYEAVTIAQCGRYMESYTYAGLIFIFMILIKNIDSYKYLLILMILSFLFVEPDSIGTLIYNPNRENTMGAQRENLKRYFAYEFDDKDMVFFNQNDFISNMVVKYLAEDKTKYITYAWQLPQDTTVDEFIELIRDKEYIFVGTYDSMLENLWYQITDTAIYNYTIYWVHENNDGSFNIEYKVSYDNK